jgi:DNA-binding Xre family transcriptional regulator
MQAIPMSRSRYTFGMLVFKFDELRRRKSYTERRDLPLRTIAEETGLSLNTVARLSKPGAVPSRLDTDTLDILCAYFNVKSIVELLEFQPDSPPT